MYHNYLKKFKDEEDDNDIIDCLGQNNNPSELIFETITEDRGTVSRFSDNIIFDSRRGEMNMQSMTPRRKNEGKQSFDIQRKIGRIS